MSSIQEENVNTFIEKGIAYLNKARRFPSDRRDKSYVDGVMTMYQVCNNQTCEYALENGPNIILTEVPIGTIHFGKFIDFDPDAIIDANAIRYIEFRVYYALRPSDGETRFTNVFSKNIKVRVAVPAEGELYGIRVFNVAPLGEVNENRSPEDVARSYFQNGDFSFFFAKPQLNEFARRNVIKHVAQLSNTHYSDKYRLHQIAYCDNPPIANQIGKLLKDDEDEIPALIIGGSAAAALSYISMFNLLSPWVILPSACYYLRYLAIKQRNIRKNRDAQRLPSDQRLKKNSAITGTLVYRLISPGISKVDTSKHTNAIVNRVFSRISRSNRGGKTRHCKRMKSLKSTTRKYKHRHHQQ
jgi:hypothetical protein